ncbi:MAG: hypothetical protein JWL76_296 [Thermoleophilia bacterium]|nr:hypothetical protein [Thermoleophilia bacterium]
MASRTASGCGIKARRADADGAVMVTSTLVDTLRRARASWRGQLTVLAAGAVLLGLTLFRGGDAGDLRLRILVGSVELLLLIAVSIRVALATEAGYDDDLQDAAYEVFTDLPRLMTQVGSVAVVPIAATWLALRSASMVPVLGLLTVPLAFAVFVFTIGPVLLATCAVVHHDRGWLPRSALRALRGHHLRVVAIMLGGGVAASFAVLPLALVGLVLNAIGGMFGFAGVGLVAASMIPLLGCGALATWRALGAQVDQGRQHAEGAGMHGDPSGGVDMATAFGVAPAVAAGVPAPVTTWLDGPTWDVAVEPGAVWGTWIRIDAPSVLGFRVAWHGGAAPDVAFASEAGVWTQAGAIGRSGDVLQAALPAGSTYVQVTSRASVAQALTLALLVPPAVAA